MSPGPDADGLAGAYRFLRAVEHRLQLVEDRQVHALPSSTPSRAHLARVLGYRDGPSATALSLFETDLARHQATARSIHERLFFRPLLEVFSAPPAEAGLGSDRLVSERLTAFGFSDARRTRAAVLELTQGFSRTSRLMHQLVPLLLDWLSESPDPDLGLLGLRRLATGPHRRAQLNALVQGVTRGGPAPVPAARDRTALRRRLRTPPRSARPAGKRPSPAARQGGPRTSGR